jgi:hypothetical protein
MQKAHNFLPQQIFVTCIFATAASYASKINNVSLSSDSWDMGEYHSVGFYRELLLSYHGIIVSV